jgi:4-hydroxy-tetrahydrodipicolinate synthase
MRKVKWEGVYPAITTKFHEDGSLDIPNFLKNLEFQVKSGIDGVIIGGSLGESSTLTQEEKVELTKISLDAVGDKIDVLLNIAEGSTREAIKLAREAEKIGAHGLMALPPMMYKPTDQEVADYFIEIAKSTSLPILIYNNPVDYKIEVTLEIFDQLIQYDNIQAVKESTRDISNVTRFRNRFGDRIKILCGVDTLAMEELVMGADGWVAGLVDAFPQETVAIYRLVKAGRIQEALKIYRWFLPILELDISPQLVQNIKLAEVMTGIGTEYVRPPRKMLQGAERKRVIKILEDGLKARPTLPDYLNL